LGAGAGWRGCGGDDKSYLLYTLQILVKDTLKSLRNTQRVYKKHAEDPQEINGGYIRETQRVFIGQIQLNPKKIAECFQEKFRASLYIPRERMRIMQREISRTIEIELSGRVTSLRIHATSIVPSLVVLLSTTAIPPLIPALSTPPTPPAPPART
jgi:predicted metallopeptidase